MKFTPFERERRFVASLNLGLIQKALWPLFGGFILLGFADALTTMVATSLSSRFVELNPLGAGLFRLGLGGFILAYVFKVIPGVPLLYIIVLPSELPVGDFQVRLLKFMALVVLIGADVYQGAIVFGNNVPQLLGFFRF